MEIELHHLDLKYEGLKVRQVREEKRLVGSLAQQGQATPVVVVTSKETPERYVLIDGFKRVRAARKVGMDQLEAAVWEIDEVDALVQMHLLQQPRERSSLEDAYLVETLQTEHGLSQGEISCRLLRSTSWVSRRLGLLRELPEWLQAQIRAGQLQCYAGAKFLVPLARANREEAEQLARNIAGLGLSTRDIGALYAAWRESGPEGRALVVTQPWVVLEARRAAKERPEGETEESEGLFQDLERVISLLQRSRRRLDRLLLGNPSNKVGERLHQTWSQIEFHGAALRRRIEAEDLNNARRRQTESDSGPASPGIRGTSDCSALAGVPHCGAQSADGGRRNGPSALAGEQSGGPPGPDCRRSAVVPGQPQPGA